MISMIDKVARTNTAPDWHRIKADFNLDSKLLHLGSSQFLASHPKPVRDAIEQYRAAIDNNPVNWTLDHENSMMDRAREAAARYLAVESPGDIAMTDSTTMGLGLVYGGLHLTENDEIVIAEDDYYSHLEAVRLCERRTGAAVKLIKLYERPSEATAEGIIDTVLSNISERTRVVGMSWVHSNTGIKTPVAAVAREIRRLNETRDKPIIFIVDAVHGFGIETETFPELGCDFFIAGCHKWLYGPRGTGIIVATSEAWQQVQPIIPTFTEVMDLNIQDKKRPSRMDGKQMTPGGFHSLEHRWALTDAFAYVEGIGKQAIRDRVYELNRRCKEGLDAMNHVTLHTPMLEQMSAGIVAFEVKGLSTKATVQKLLERSIIATEAPYYKSYVRFTPGIYNTPEEVDQGLEAVRSLAGLSE